MKTKRNLEDAVSARVVIFLALWGDPTEYCLIHPLRLNAHVYKWGLLAELPTRYYAELGAPCIWRRNLHW